MKNQVVLLPQEYLKAIEKKDKLTKFQFSLVPVFLIVLVMVLLTTYISVINKVKNDDYLSEIQAANDEIIYYSKYKNMQKLIEDYNQCLTNILQSDKRYLNSISEISNQLPAGIWIENITTNEETNLISVVCGGNSPSDVGRTISALLELPNIIQVYCKNSGDNSGAVRFTLEIQISQNKQ
ncbi:MAG: hypothetical protein RSD67_04925 [Oscillospiraceae bacterium]